MCRVVSVAGYSLIEVLVAVSVLSIGILGLASLQVTALRFNQSAHLRTQATHLAYDMADRLRVNRQVALQGDYALPELADPAPACVPVVLDGATLAERDLQAWLANLACTLPQGTGRITQDEGIFTILVQWDDSQGRQPPQSFSMETRP